MKFLDKKIYIILFIGIIMIFSNAKYSYANELSDNISNYEDKGITRSW